MFCELSLVNHLISTDTTGRHFYCTEICITIFTPYLSHLHKNINNYFNTRKHSQSKKPQSKLTTHGHVYSSNSQISSSGFPHWNTHCLIQKFPHQSILRLVNLKTNSCRRSTWKTESTTFCSKDYALETIHENLFTTFSVILQKIIQTNLQMDHKKQNLLGTHNNNNNHSKYQYFSAKQRQLSFDKQDCLQLKVDHMRMCT